MTTTPTDIAKHLRALADKIDANAEFGVQGVAVIFPPQSDPIERIIIGSNADDATFFEMMGQAIKSAVDQNRGYLR